MTIKLGESIQINKIVLGEDPSAAVNYTGEGTFHPSSIPFTVSAGAWVKVVSGLDAMSTYNVSFAPTSFGAYLVGSDSMSSGFNMSSSPQLVDMSIFGSTELWIYNSSLSDLEITAFDVQI